MFFTFNRRRYILGIRRGVYVIILDVPMLFVRDFVFVTQILDDWRRFILLRSGGSRFRQWYLLIVQWVMSFGCRLCVRYDVAVDLQTNEEIFMRWIWKRGAG